jgi:hypothetical protein
MIDIDTIREHIGTLLDHLRDRASSLVLAQISIPKVLNISDEEREELQSINNCAMEYFTQSFVLLVQVKNVVTVDIESLQKLAIVDSFTKAFNMHLEELEKRLLKHAHNNQRIIISNPPCCTHDTLRTYKRSKA